MSKSTFNLKPNLYEGINLDELRLLAENTILLEKMPNCPIYKKFKGYKKSFREFIKINKKEDKIFKKIEKLKNKLAKLRGLENDR